MAGVTKDKLTAFREQVIKRMEKVDEGINKLDLEFLQLAFLASNGKDNVNAGQNIEEQKDNFLEDPDVVNSKKLDLLLKQEFGDRNYNDDDDEEEEEDDDDDDDDDEDEDDESD